MNKDDQLIERKKRGRKPVDFPVHLTVEYVPLPEDREASWRAGLRLLLDLLKEERYLYERELAEGKSEIGDK